MTRVKQLGAVLMILLLSQSGSANEYDDEETSTADEAVDYWRLGVDEARSRMYDLGRNFAHIWYMITPYSLRQQLFQVIKKAIETNSDVVSLKAELNRIFPAFWKVFRRKRCERLLCEKIEKITLELSAATIDMARAEIEETQNLVDATGEKVKSFKADCESVPELCYLTPDEKDDLEGDMKAIKQKTRVILNKLLSVGLNNINRVIRAALIVPVNDCLLNDRKPVIKTC